MYHSVTFVDDAGEYNTYSTWHLVPTSRPIIPPPTTDAYLNYMQDDRKALVLSAYDPNELMIYREGSFNFEFESYHTFDDSNEATSWAKTYSDVLCALHGRKMKIVLEDDPLYFYYGVVSVEWKNDKRSQITIGVYCEPYKYKEYTAHSVNRTSKATITPDTKFVTPAIVTITPIQDIVELTITGLSRNPITGAAEDIVLSSLKANAAVTIDGESKLILQGGENKYSDSDFWNFPTVIPGSNSLTFSSTLCNVNIKYKPRYL